MLRIKNGTVVTPCAMKRSDLYIEGEKVFQIGGDAPFDAEYDAGGCLIFPGFIDSHTHLGMDAGSTWTIDDWSSGTLAALAGGTTTVLDFATQDRGGTLSAALDTWHSRANGKAYCDYGFHMAVTDWNAQTKREIAEMPGRGVTSFKAYMAYDNLRLSNDELRELLAETRDIGLVGVHCELGSEVTRRVRALLDAGKTGPEFHPLSRPNAVEADAVRRLMELARQAGAPAWVVHLSTREGLDEIRKARADGQTVLAETCPQYLTLTDEVYITPGFDGAKYVCSPPIRSLADQDALWGATASGEVDIISTDHCSFSFSGQKELGRGDFSKIPNGLPGIEHRPALIWESGVNAGRMTACGMARLLSEAPAKAFGMWPRKGAIMVGADADLVIWDPNSRWTISAENQHMRADYSPWEGFSVSGQARAVFLRGRLAFENGAAVGPASGSFIARRCLKNSLL